MSVSATARFTVTVDVPLGTQKLCRGLQGLDYKIIGEPKLLTMMTAEG